MKLLAICIPNYNRIKKLERLICETARQIFEYSLTEQVQICISDDCSPENPEGMIETVRQKYPQVEILFERNEQNKGMDYNFLQSVMMASSEYCWIIGNDDVPTEDGIRTVFGILRTEKNVDILLTPFDIYDDNDKIRQPIYPLNTDKKMMVDTSNREQYTQLILTVRHNSGLFGFLSNVIFRRRKWTEYRERFLNKMDTIFIQVYMNIQSLEDGAVFLYMPDKVIKNYADDEANNSIDRICKVLFGLEGVVEYFFSGKEKEHLKRVFVDGCISGIVWDLPEESQYKKKVRAIISPKNQIYKKYFVPIQERKLFFKGKKVLIYGTGNYGRKTYEELKKYDVVVLGAADSDNSKIGMDFEGFAIMSVESMAEQYKKQEMYVLPANHYSLETMINTLLKYGIEKIGIIS